MLRDYILLKLKIGIQVSNRGILSPSVQVFSYIGLWVQTSAQPKSQDDYHKSDLTGLTGLISSLQALNSEDNTHKFLTQKVTNT